VLRRHYADDDEVEDEELERHPEQPVPGDRELAQQWLRFVRYDRYPSLNKL